MIRRIIPASLAMLFIGGCGIVVPKKMPWSFVESVGGMAVDAPRVEGETLILPVRADVSGLSTITMKPTTMNSALLCPATYAKVKGHDILVAITTDVAGRGNKSSACPPAKLRAPAAGKYQVFYGDQREGAVALGEITIVR